MQTAPDQQLASLANSDRTIGEQEEDRRNKQQHPGQVGTYVGMGSVANASLSNAPIDALPFIRVNSGPSAGAVNVTKCTALHDREVSLRSPFVKENQMAQEHQGTLMKACQRMCVAAWQLRFFVLRGSSLLYYSDSSCSLLKGDIRLDASGASVTKVQMPSQRSSQPL